MKRILILLAILLVPGTSRAQTPPVQKQKPQTSEPQTPPAPVVSPGILADHRVTFRLRAPNAKEVSVQIEGASKPLAMQKDDEGVWSGTTDPLAPDYYGYAFIADGVAMFDPSNSATKPNFLYRASELHVAPAAANSGDSASPAWEIADVPHGEVHHHFYRSKVVGDERGYFVYTPLGYGAPEILTPNSGGFRDPGIAQRNLDRFREALLSEVIPRVEAEYLVMKERDSRAIAGLSMGGAESLLTGLNNLNEFAWIGAFSSGGITPDFEKEFPGLETSANTQLRLLWIACGADDHLIEINRTLRAWLASKSIHHVDIETPGSHTWMVWRRNLNDFAPLLFR